MIEDNPALNLGKIVVKHKQKVPFTDEELIAIEKAAVDRIEDMTRSEAERERSRRAYALILLMRYTGLRISDATLLARDSLKGNHIELVTEKTSTPVSVFVGEPVIEALQGFTPETKTHYF
jgi:integrase